MTAKNGFPLIYFALAACLAAALASGCVTGKRLAEVSPRPDGARPPQLIPPLRMEPARIPAPQKTPVPLSAGTDAGPGGAAAPERPPAAEAMEAAAAVRMEVLVAQFRLTAGAYFNRRGFSSNRYRYTGDELRMLAVVIHLEARSEPYRAQLAVGNVVMNRVLAPGYPGDTIAEVVTAPNQFCYDPSVKPEAECLRAARDVLEYEAWVVPQNTYFFRATDSASDWGSHAFYAHIGGTAFYRDSYAGRWNGSAVPERLYARAYQWPQYGCKPGERVRKIQVMLGSLGYELEADGYFGEQTRKRLAAFQKDHGLAADGVAGPVTLKKLIGLYGLDRYLKL